METIIRNATLSDIPSILDFAKHVGRYISADEVQTFLQVDPEAMFVVEAYPGGKLIGSCCATRLTPELGYMGLYVVLEKFRGKGIGLKLWKAAKDHLGDRNIGVRGDPINFKKYTENDGFCHVEDYSMIYYVCFGDSLPTNLNLASDIEVVTYFEGKFIGSSKKFDSSTEKHKPRQISSEIESDAGNFDSNSTFTEEGKTEHIEDFEKSSVNVDYSNTCKSFGGDYVGKCLTLNAEDMSIQFGNETPLNSINPNGIKNSKAEDILDRVVSFDKQLHKRDRSFIVRQTFSWSSCRSKIALQGCKVVGYACLRKVVTEHWLISPFYADTEDVAEILLLELLQKFDFSEAPKGIQIRFPDKNTACERLAEKFGFRKNSILILTGFTRQCINVDTSKVYSFHSTVFCSE